MRAPGGSQAAPKTTGLLIAVALAALVCGCGSVTTITHAELSGTYDVAVVNDLVFVTSANRNELRVIDTSANPRDFVRAPNPIEPLSIPVVDQPVELARDIRYDGKYLDPKAPTGGAETDGPYVYVRGLGSAEISIVGAAPDQLKTLNHVIAPATVTALAAQGPAEGKGASTLYFATWDGTRGTLWSVSVPEVGSLSGASLAPTVIVSNDGEAIRSIAVMPDERSSVDASIHHRIALATRNDQGTTGRSLLLDLTDLSTRVLDFPAPVRRLFTHAAYIAPGATASSDDDVPIAAGARIFGVLDEASCGAKRRCQGLIAVESATGQIVQDFSGHPMVPLSFGRALISGVTVTPNGTVLLGADSSGTPQYTGQGLLGVATTTGDSNVTGGEIYFFDADFPRQIDSNGDVAKVVSTAYVDASGGARTDVNGPAFTDDSLGDGAVESQTFFITYQGIIAGLKDVPTQDSDGQRFVAPGIDLLDRVAVGDTVQILAPDPACTAELTVSSVEADAVVVSDPIPAACQNRTAFTVRTSGAEPYVVEGSVDGFMGRVGPNQTFTYPAPASFSAASASCPTGPAYCSLPCPPGQQAACAVASGNDYSAAYFYHSNLFSPGKPELQFHFGAGDPAIERGFQYQVVVTSNYQPLLIVPDASVFPGWYLPGSVAYFQKFVPAKDSPTGTDQTIDLVYVAYPSVQGVLQFDPTQIVPNAGNGSNLVGYQ